MATVVGSAFH